MGKHGIRVTGRIPLAIRPNAHNLRYLRTKMEKSGHYLEEVLAGTGRKVGTGRRVGRGGKGTKGKKGTK